MVLSYNVSHSDDSDAVRTTSFLDRMHTVPIRVRPSYVHRWIEQTINAYDYSLGLHWYHSDTLRQDGEE